MTRKKKQISVLLFTLVFLLSFHLPGLAAAKTTPVLLPQTVWEDQDFLPIETEHVPQSAKLVLVKSSDPGVIRVVSYGSSLNSCRLDAQKAGQSTITIRYKAGKKETTLSALFTVQRKPHAFVLPENPYKNIAWGAVQDVTSVSHAHCVTQKHFETLKAHYEHIAISNYHPSIPYYPLSAWFTGTDGVLASPNAEHKYFKGANSHLHMNCIGGYLQSDTDAKYDGTPSDLISDGLSSLMMENGGGITINHPYWSGLSAQDIIDVMDQGGVIAIEIWNATCEQLNKKGFSLDLWDQVLSQGRQLFATAVPDHEAKYKPNETRQPFGYNHILVINKTEEEILYAYRQGHFYATLYNDGLQLKKCVLSNDTLSIETSAKCTFVFKTAKRTVTVKKASKTAAFSIHHDDVYVRVEATRGKNKLFTNAIILP